MSSSHILTEISETCDCILVLRQGEIVASGTEGELSNRLLRGAEVLLTVRTDAVASTRALLGRVEGVTLVEPIGARESGAGIATFRVEAAKDVRESLSRALVEAKVGLLEMVRGKRELESIFLQLTGGEPDEVSDETGSGGLPS